MLGRRRVGRQVPGACAQGEFAGTDPRDMAGIALTSVAPVGSLAFSFKADSEVAAFTAKESKHLFKGAS
jgi:hypothetical protein